MRKLDLRSLVIGILMTIIFFLLTGQNAAIENGVFKSLVVDELEVNGGIAIMGLNNTPKIFLSADGDSGKIEIYGEDFKRHVFIGTDVNGGLLEVYENGINGFLGRAEYRGASMRIYNKNLKRTVDLSTHVDDNGTLILFSKYGDYGWSATGKL